MPPVATTPRATRRALWLGVVALIAAGGAVGAIVAATPSEPPRAPETRPRDLRDAVVVRDTGIVAAIEVSVARDTGPVAPLDTALEMRSLDGVSEDVPIRRQRDAETPREVVTAAVGAHRIRITASEGPVHVRGGGRAGLAPWLSEPLSEGESVPLHVVGGQRPLTAVVRVRNRKNAGLTASIGAADGLVYDVSCAGRATQQTPVFGIDVSAAGVACRLEASDGRTMAFVLLDVAE